MSETTPVPPPSGPPDVPPGGAVPPSPTDPMHALNSRIATLTQNGDNGAKWFYWVAGLSLVNSAIQLSGGDFFFVVGLAVTAIADAIAVQIATESPDVATAAKVLTIGFDLVVALVLCGFGWLSSKRFLSVFAIGMVLYTLDGLLYLQLQDWMSVAFHAFALYSMGVGFMAYRELNALRRQAVHAGQ